MHDYELPRNPGDSEANSFDNGGEGLVMSASHMASTQVASEVADLLYPQPKQSVPQKYRRAVWTILCSFLPCRRDGKRDLHPARDI